MMGLQGTADHDIPSTGQCPECDHDIPLDPDWQEGDIFACPSCAIEIQVTSVEPLWLEIAPETDRGWEDSDEATEISLDEAEEMEDEEEGVESEDEDDWTGSISRRVAVLRSPRPRARARVESVEAVAPETILLTPEGAARLHEELRYLEQTRLPKVTAWLSEALAEGFEVEDVTELEEARSELSFIEGRIRNLKHLLASAEYLSEPEDRETVQLGNRVTIAEVDAEPETYRIVSPAEADPLEGYVSNASPLGKALIGHRVGETVTVKSPEGPILFRIIDIQ